MTFLKTPLASFAALIVGLAVAACAPSDPLPAIREQQARGDYQGTIEPLRDLLAERKGDAEVQFLYGRALAMTAQTSLSEWSLREAMKDPKWLVPAGEQLIQGALIAEDFPMAIETANEVLAVEPENIDILLARANAYAHSRLHNEEALEDANHILDLDPENLEAMEPKILALLAMERVDEAGEAIDHLGKLIEDADPGSEIAGWHCATAALFADESGEAELARKRWEDCVERFPEHGNVISNAVDYYDEHGEQERSLEILRKGQELNPESRELRAVLALRLRAAGHPEEAEALLLAATETPLPHLAAAAWVDLVKHYQDVEDYPAAARAAEKAYDLAQEAGEVHPQLRLEFADALLLAGELDRALEIAQGMTVPAHKEMILARVAQERGQPVEALEHFDRAFELWPDNPFARYYAALAAEEIGDFDRAIAAYRYAIRISAGATEARLRIARLHAAEGNLTDALLLLRIQEGQSPLELDGELFSLYLWARSGQEQRARQVLGVFAKSLPVQFGKAAAAVARGLRERAGAAAAVHMLLGTASGGLDLSDPQQVDALRALVRYAQEAGQRAEAEPRVAAALRAHPDAAVFHEVRGLLLELSGSAEEARAAYSRAVELDAGNAKALAGLGRLSLADDPAQALGFFERAASADPEDAEPLRGAAQALTREAKPAEAEAKLDALLSAHPFDAPAAMELVELHLDQGTANEETLERARRAVRFGGGIPALELLARVHEQRGEVEEAGRVRERARLRQERRNAHAEGGGVPRGEE